MYYTQPKKVQRGTAKGWEIELKDPTKQYDTGEDMTQKVVFRTTKKDILEYMKAHPVQSSQMKDLSRKLGKKLLP